jgi:hypothetical protein
MRRAIFYLSKGSTSVMCVSIVCVGRAWWCRGWGGGGKVDAFTGEMLLSTLHNRNVQPDWPAVSNTAYYFLM